MSFLYQSRNLAKAKGTPFSKTFFLPKNVTNNSICFIVNNFRTDQFRHSFFIDGVIKWNHLLDSIVHADSVESFKSVRIIRGKDRNGPERTRMGLPNRNGHQT